MDATLSELQDALSLKRDGRRVSLEGVITGSALGLFLVYQLRDKQGPLPQIDIGADEAWLSAGGPAPLPAAGAATPVVAAAEELNTEDGAGALTSSGLLSPAFDQGLDQDGDYRHLLGGLGGEQIAAANLANVLQSGNGLGGGLGGFTGPLAGGSNPGLALGGTAGGSTGGRGDGGSRRLNDWLGGANWSDESLVVDPVSDDLSSSASVPGDVALPPLTFPQSQSGTRLPSLSPGEQAGAPPPSGLETGGSPSTPPVLPPPPKVLLVQVGTNTDSSARSEFDVASAAVESRQAVLDGVTFDLRGSDRDHVVLISNQQIEIESTVGSSQAGAPMAEAVLQVLSSNFGIVDSSIQADAATDVVVIKASDLLAGSLDGGSGSEASVDLQTIAMQASTLVAQLAPTSIEIAAESGLSFHALTDLNRSSFEFDLLTQALDQSSLLLGDQADRVIISSSIGSANSPELVLRQQEPIVAANNSEEELSLAASPQGHFVFNAAAVGLGNGSVVDTAGGNDYVSVSARVNLDASISPEDASRLVVDGEIEEIALLDSALLLGDGDDVALVDGAVINSLVDLGEGRNNLLLADSILASVVQGGSGPNEIQLADAPNTLGLDVKGRVNLSGGNASDVIVLASLPTQASVDTQGGLDTVVFDTADGVQVRVDRQGDVHAGNVTLANAESLGLSQHDDVLSMLRGSSMAGLLDGRAGFDVLDYSRFGQSVVVDLDAGSASGIRSGSVASMVNFEGVVGSGQADQFSVSGMQGKFVDTGDGEDLVYLRWAPWADTEPKAPTEILGGTGRDLFVWSGLAGLASSMTPQLDSVAPFVLPDLRLVGSGNGYLGLTDTIALGSTASILTPTGISGVGDSRLLPIAPIESLMAGVGAVGRDFSQLAIAYDFGSTSGAASMLNLSSSSGIFGGSLLASLPNFSAATSRSSFSASFGMA